MKIIVSACCVLCSFSVLAAEVRVAVAANFQGTLQTLAEIYKAERGDTLRISSGSSGALYTQIVNGAPFDVFLSADAGRPKQLEAEGFAVEGSLVIYATGVLVLWSASADVVDAGGRVLRDGTFRHLAIAEPRNAPYGAAAREVLVHLGLWDTLNDGARLVRGKTIGQTHAHVATGAAELGFVALAQVRTAEGVTGSYWIPPADLYAPIAQAAVVLTRAGNMAAARAFLDWLRTDPTARGVIASAGYTLE